MGKGSIKKASSKAKAQSNSRPTPKKASKKNANAPALTGAKSTLPTSTPLTSNLIKVSKKVNLKHLETQLPKLNTIVPAGVVKPKGKKKGKVFVDDRETMKRILAVVSEAVEGKEQGKIERQRNLEIIREAKREEAERKEGQKQEKLVSRQSAPLGCKRNC